MDDVIQVNLLNSDRVIPFVLTYGIRKELTTYLLSENRLFVIYTDQEVSEEVIRICLSERNDIGQIIKPFENFNQLSSTDSEMILDLVQEDISNFFLKSQERSKKLVAALKATT